MNISVVGIGYVGMAYAVLLAQKHNVIAVDVDKRKVDLLNQKQSWLEDKEIQEFLLNKSLRLQATMDGAKAYKNADFILISVPTNFDEEKGGFDTTIIELIIEQVRSNNQDGIIVIKSTIPIGYTERVRKKYKDNKIIFSPEFLREGHALYDNLYPSRVIVSAPKEDLKLYKKAESFAKILCERAFKKNIDVLVLSLAEAEAVKLFSNMYLAMRVSFFNELDTFAIAKNMNARQIIQGMSLDSRIGNVYNNPSFGYGGYCLPKDTKQLINSYGDEIPNCVMQAVAESNTKRIDFIAKDILGKAGCKVSSNRKVIGIFRLIMKANADNYRESSVIGIIDRLKSNKVKVIIYEPNVHENQFDECEVIRDFNEFVEQADIIIANRLSEELGDIKSKVYTRDIFGRD